MVKTPLIRVTDVHSRPLPHRLQTLQLVDFGGVVFRGDDDFFLRDRHLEILPKPTTPTTEKLLFTYF
jgi:hypothetical protein